MTRELDVLHALTEAIGKLNELDDQRAAELAALRDDVCALSNRIEALTRARFEVRPARVCDCGAPIYLDTSSRTLPQPWRNVEGNTLHSCLR